MDKYNLEMDEYNYLHFTNAANLLERSHHGGTLAVQHGLDRLHGLQRLGGLHQLEGGAGQEARVDPRRYTPRTHLEYGGQYG